eukprot:SAG31_NODE_974_length_10627_cov_11.246201_3_plen_82_part_00
MYRSLIKKGADIGVTDHKGQIVLKYCKDKTVRGYLSTCLEKALSKNDSIAGTTDECGCKSHRRRKKSGRNRDEFAPCERHG